MDMKRNLHLAGLVFSIANCIAAGSALAQPYPTKSIRLVVPYAPGGGTDILARSFGQKLGESMGQQIVIDNRPGANGIIGTNLVAKVAPNGYTILITTNALSVNPGLHSKIPFDTLNDFAPVTIVATAPNLLVVHPSVPAKTVRGLIALAKARPGQLSFASGGAGQPSHLSGELFKLMAGVDMIHVAYKGTGQSIPDLLGGQVALSFSSVPSLQPYVKAGKLRALGVTSLQRSVIMPEVPAIAETLPGFDVSLWYGILAPAGTAKEIIGKLHAETVKTLNHPDIKARLASQGYGPGGTTPEQFSTIIREDLSKWAKVIKEAGIRLE